MSLHYVQSKISIKSSENEKIGRHLWTILNRSENEAREIHIFTNNN